MASEKRLFLSSLTRWFRYFCTIFAVVSAATIVVMIFSTTIDTTLRYVFASPIPGVFELNEAILVVCVFMGLAWTQMQRGHIRVSLFVRRLSPRWMVRVDLVTWILCFLFLAVLAIESGKDALYSYNIKEFRWGAVEMPIWWAKALVPIGCWLMCIQLVIDIWTDICRLCGRLPLEVPDLLSQEMKTE